MLGESPDGNTVHAGFSDGAHGFQRDIAGGFELGAPGGDRYRATHRVQVEIIEQDQFRAGSQRSVELRQRFHLDLHGDAIAGQLKRRCQYRRDSAGSCNVVFLDEDAVVQPDALILPAAHTHGVFFGQPQAWQRLAGIQNGSAGAGHGVDIGSGGGGHSRQGLQKIQRRTFSSKQRAGGAVESDQQGIWCHCVAFIHLPVDTAIRGQCAEAGVEPGPAGDNRRLAGDDAGVGGLLCRHQPGGEIAAADVFFQRTRHIGFHGRQQ